jgi:hypothetical protein
MIGLAATALGLATAPVARAEAILTVGGLALQPGANGELRLNVDLDLAGAAPNLVSFDFDVLHPGLAYVSHTIGDAFEVDGDPLTTEVIDATTADPTASQQNVLGILPAPHLGLVTGRLFSMDFLLQDAATASLSLLGFPVAEIFDDVFRSESLVSEVAPLDLQAVPFIILLTSNLPGEVTMRLTTERIPDPDPSRVDEPATLLLAGIGCLAIAAIGRRQRSPSPQRQLLRSGGTR